MDNQRKHRMGIVAFVIFLIGALIGDIAGLIPGLETAIASIFWGVFAIYSWIAGLGTLRGKKLATALASWIIGLFPFIQTIPQLTIGIIAIFLLSRAEEKTGISFHGGTKGRSAITSVRGTPTRLPTTSPPLNREGVRLPQT